MPLQVAVTLPPAPTLDGVAESVAAGTPTPTTGGLAPFPPVNVRLLATLPVDVGRKRTATFWLCPADRLYDSPVTILKGALVVAVPTSTPPPLFLTTKLRSAEFPT